LDVARERYLLFMPHVEYFFVLIVTKVYEFLPSLSNDECNEVLAIEDGHYSIDFHVLAVTEVIMWRLPRALLTSVSLVVLPARAR
jgi:hypothetical protein